MTEDSKGLSPAISYLDVARRGGHILTPALAGVKGGDILPHGVTLHSDRAPQPLVVAHLKRGLFSGQVIIFTLHAFYPGFLNIMKISVQKDGQAKISVSLAKQLGMLSGTSRRLGRAMARDRSSHSTTRSRSPKQDQDLSTTRPSPFFRPPGWQPPTPQAHRPVILQIDLQPMHQLALRDPYTEEVSQNSFVLDVAKFKN